MRELLVQWAGRCLVVCGLAIGVQGAARADLIEYIKKPEPAFAWKLKEKIAHPLGAVYDIHLISQVWQGITWEHQLQVYQPKGIAPTATMLLWNQGGKANLANTAFGMMLAQKVQAPIAFLYGIPNQPLFDGKKEDALIAETFVRYLNTQDGSWPLLFPMAKSLVKAMDAVQAFSKQEWQKPVENFVVCGASKRGWTTWLTGASDARVKAIAPMVIDTLNMKDQMQHQVDAFGKYSEQINDYTSRGLVPMPNTPEAKKLWRMVDPYLYVDRLQMPKLMINGNNDPYWTVDALNLYWDSLKGDKWVLYVPNAGHNLQQMTAEGKRDTTRAINGLAAFARHYIKDNPMPKVSWKHDESDGKLRLTVQASPGPEGARLWVAQAKSRDFRKSQWLEKTAQLKDGVTTGEIEPPHDGFLSFYAELDYTMDGLPYHLSTQIRVVGK